MKPQTTRPRPRGPAGFTTQLAPYPNIDPTLLEFVHENANELVRREREVAKLKAWGREWPRTARGFSNGDGTFHSVSRKHLHRYVAEFEFRWNTRKMDDGARIKAAIQGSEGKRLMYRHP